MNPGRSPEITHNKMPPETPNLSKSRIPFTRPATVFHPASSPAPAFITCMALGPNIKNFGLFDLLLSTSVGRCHKPTPPRNGWQALTIQKTQRFLLLHLCSQPTPVKQWVKQVTQCQVLKQFVFHLRPHNRTQLDPFCSCSLTNFILGTVGTPENMGTKINALRNHVVRWPSVFFFSSCVMICRVRSWYPGGWPRAFSPSKTKAARYSNNWPSCFFDSWNRLECNLKSVIVQVLFKLAVWRKSQSKRLGSTVTTVGAWQQIATSNANREIPRIPTHLVFPSFMPLPTLLVDQPKLLNAVQHLSDLIVQFSGPGVPWAVTIFWQIVRTRFWSQHNWKYQWLQHFSCFKVAVR